MEKTTTELTIEYIKGHPDIKNCLKKGIINYSSLARLVAKELKIEKKTSKEAILIAARRFYEKIRNELGDEKEIRELLSKSELEIKNKINVFILEKSLNLEETDEAQKIIRKERGTFYLLEGSNNYTLITQEKYSKLIKDKFRSKIIKHEQSLVLINLKSEKEIEFTRGVVAYLLSLFAENGVNVLELFSCWTDTVITIAENDSAKVLEFLSFK